MVFIPMYNCEKQIVRVLNQFTKEVCSYIKEIVIVNNRSTDNSEKKVIQYLDKNPLLCKVNLLRNNDNYGLGGSHKVAFQYSIDHKFDYIILLHGDDQGSIDNLLPYLKSGEYRNYDCFLGSRFMIGSKLKGYSWFRNFGNHVYNILFSIGCGKWITDLGSGLNMYKVSILKNHFYIKYKDNLVFNYCMIMGSTYYKHRIKFFPIIWREDDQVSNVKMLNQAITVLKLLFEFIESKKKFVENEHRDKIIPEYKAEIIYTSESKE